MTRVGGALRCCALAAAALAVATSPGVAQSAREMAEGLRFAPVRFDAPVPEVHEVAGVQVLFIEDRSVPLVDVFARFKGGYARLPRQEYAAATALASLLRYGGTTGLPPDSVDARLEYYALQTTFGSGGESVFSSLNTLSKNLDPALDLWGDMLRNPAFDSAEVEGWRGREMEGVRRRSDDPQRLAFTEFNRLLYGDHPVGWEMDVDDLVPERVSSDALRRVRGRIVCPEHLILGVSGDVSWDEIEPRLEALVTGWPACTAPLPPPPVPDIREGAGVFLIPRKLEQSVLVMAHPTDVHLSEDPDYFAAQIGNAILGSGGFSSRILSKVRTEEGYAYSAASLWTTPRTVRGVVGAVTRTRPENAVPALRLILETMQEMRDAPPRDEEVRTSVDQIVNGFVFNFDSAAQIVSRRMSFLAMDLPEDWLERYLAGVQGVTPAAIQKVFRQHLHPRDMTILVVGDPDRMGWDALRSLGPVTILDVTPSP
ncbi:MAG TPA: pitrilysin family protein [Longimicrobiales bacterium]|nr:pitrilysin family protein [Longimicrobiales bacterium]